MNIGKCHAQPRSKPHPKRLDIVAALQEPSETQLAAYQIQLDRQSQPGQILSVAIKTEIKTEIKQEIERTNTRHKYKGKPLWGKPNYIHPDGTPCKRSMREELELPDLPNLTDTDSVLTRGLRVETTNQEAEQGTTTPQKNTQNAITANSAIPTPGLHVETSGIITPKPTQKNITELNTPNIPEKDSSDGLQVETFNPNENHDIEQLENSSELDTQNRLQVEKDNADEAESGNENRLQVKPQDKHEPKNVHGNTNLEETNGDNGVNGLTVETEDNQPEQIDQLNEAAMGLIMLGQEEKDTLLDKYDNSELLPVDAARQTDFGLDPNAANTTLKITENETQTEDAGTNKSSEETTLDNPNYDSDDTILHELEKEISDVIGNKLTSEADTDEDISPTLQNGLTGETTDRDETNKITNQLANLTVMAHPKNSVKPKKDGLPLEMANTPVSPSKGKVIIQSYKLRWTVSSDVEKIDKTPPEPDNMENEVLHPMVPSGNATRPPPPNKYKIQKFQIDNVRYYSCMYCNKYFDSIHHLNMHHKKHHPLVSCDMCNKLYDTPNSLIRHSYKHLDGQFKCKTCDQSFHFKGELESHSMKHSKEWLYCKKCDKSFIRNSDLNTHIDTHGNKWKCSYPGCTKECPDKRYLNTHMKVHSAELKYQCRKCKKCFRFYEQRKRHEADHS